MSKRTFQWREAVPGGSWVVFHVRPQGSLSSTVLSVEMTARDAYVLASTRLLAMRFTREELLEFAGTLHQLAIRLPMAKEAA
jgi:hypothetical protein